VARGANKIQVKHAVEEQLLGAKVESVRTTISHGKSSGRDVSPAAARLEEGLCEAPRRREDSGIFGGA